ncbi:Translation initiation factor eIF-2B subunit delta [Acropora cervicornis]|uniref:Translation initiation factor eIF2B subunit delta n=1 Tax=Acropora cervicornis TaxID=6130 RepID=A0AAD9V3S6_ACRCE|nr:Translation initiation factor eIF-2B subunit delta [Acropora cervicornis]
MADSAKEKNTQGKKNEKQATKPTLAAEGESKVQTSSQPKGEKHQQERKGTKQQKSGEKNEQKQQSVQKQQKPDQQAASKKAEKSAVPIKDEKPSAARSDGADAPEKTKAELKAERRAKQEAQRLAKAQKQAEAGVKHKTGTEGHRVMVAHDLQADDEKVQKRVAKKLARQQVPQRTSPQKKVGLFSHLHQYEKDVSLTQEISLGSVGSIHPAIITLGVQYAKGIISGSNARCVALLLAFKKCRPLSVSMGNAIKYLKLQITHSPPDVPDEQAKRCLVDSIDKFIQERIVLAGVAISETYARTKINDDDVILTYAW